MNRITAPLAGLAAAAVIALVPSAAQADRVPVNEGGDTAPCVTYQEYLTIQDAFMHQGITSGQVRRVFDTDGHRTSTAAMDALAGQVSVAPGYEVVVPKGRVVRSYPVCVDPVLTPTGGVVSVEYNRRDRMVAGVFG